MYGQIQWCMKHGHDWKTVSLYGETTVLECAVCGARQLRAFN